MSASDYELLETYKKEFPKLQQENQQLKELEYKFTDESGDESSFTLEEYLNINDELYEAEQQLQQKNSIIEKTIQFCNYLLENDLVEIDGHKYFKHECDDIITNEILKILKKYKGEENGTN